MDSRRPTVPWGSFSSRPLLINTSECPIINVTQFGLNKLSWSRSGPRKCVNDCCHLQVTLNWTFKSSVLIEILMSVMPSCFLHWWAAAIAAVLAFTRWLQLLRAAIPCRSRKKIEPISIRVASLDNHSIITENNDYLTICPSKSDMVTIVACVNTGLGAPVS